MTNQLIVLIADREDPKHGEIALCATAAAAERLVETLLEAGIDQDRLRVFAGTEMDARVSHRPVVALVDRPQEELPPDGDAVEQPSADEKLQPHAGEVPVEAEASRNGSAPVLNSIPAQPVEMMPELLH